jgi:hypothetical protein
MTGASVASCATSRGGSGRNQFANEQRRKKQSADPDYVSYDGHDYLSPV